MGLAVPTETDKCHSIRISYEWRLTRANESGSNPIIVKHS